MHFPKSQTTLVLGIKKGYFYHDPIELYQSSSNFPLFTGPIGIVPRHLAQHLRELSSIGSLKECFRGKQNPCPYKNQVRGSRYPDEKRGCCAGCG
jgi:hypothetical protein